MADHKGSPRSGRFWWACEGWRSWLPLKGAMTARSGPKEHIAMMQGRGQSGRNSARARRRRQGPKVGLRATNAVPNALLASRHALSKIGECS